MHSMFDVLSLIKSTAIVWGPFASGLIAAFVVHLLTQSREREKWILDCKKQEFKELLNTISDSYSKRLRSHGPFPRVFDEGEQRESAKIQPEVYRMFRNCLYICDDLDLRAPSNDWLVALQSNDLGVLHTSFDEVSRTIVQAANRSVPKSAFQRLHFWKGFLTKRKTRVRFKAKSLLERN